MVEEFVILENQSVGFAHSQNFALQLESEELNYGKFL
jgi:hypothetical protein